MSEAGYKVIFLLPEKKLFSVKTSIIENEKVF